MAVMPVLITFIPMLMGTGGNCGSQSSTLVIRGLAVGEIEFKDIFRVLFKEIRVAVVVGLMLAVVNGLRIYIMYDQKTWKEDLIFEKDSFELLQDILESAGELDSRTPYESLVTTEFAKEALKK